MKRWIIGPEQDGSNVDAAAQSPCVRNCCLDDDLICLGCFRSLEESKNGRSSTNIDTVSFCRTQNREETGVGCRKMSPSLPLHIAIDC